MLERMLPVAVVLMTALAVISASLLVRAAIRKPWIGALVERAGIGALIAFFGVVSVVLVLNTESGYLLMDREAASNVFRLTLLGLLAVPSFWDWLYFTGRLGGGDGLSAAAALLRSHGWTVVEPT